MINKCVVFASSMVITLSMAFGLWQVIANGERERGSVTITVETCAIGGLEVSHGDSTSCQEVQIVADPPANCDVRSHSQECPGRI